MITSIPAKSQSYLHHPLREGPSPRKISYPILYGPYSVIIYNRSGHWESQFGIPKRKLLCQSLVPRFEILKIIFWNFILCWSFHFRLWENIKWIFIRLNDKTIDSNSQLDQVPPQPLFLLYKWSLLKIICRWRLIYLLKKQGSQSSNWPPWNK